MNRIAMYFLSRQFVIFVFIGGFNTLSGTVFAYLYSLWFNVNQAFVFGYLSSLTIAYILNTTINFKEKINLKKFVKFMISYIPNFMIQNLVVYIVFNCMGYAKLTAYLIAAVLGIPITFVCVKGFAFGIPKK